MRTKIIAEVSWNHMGNMSRAKDMIDEAEKCGADFVKFQTWSVQNLKSGEWDGDGRRQIYEEAELTKEKHQELYDYVLGRDINFLTSLFNADDIELLPDGYVDYIKIPSTEISNTRLLDRCLERFDHLIISTGASTTNEVYAAYQRCVGKCTLMHCVSMYPCDRASANLRRIQYLKLITRDVGYSDHTYGPIAPIYAMSNECTFVEKHFTTDPSLPGRDNKFAATPDILKQICSARDELEELTHQFCTEYQAGEESARTCYRGRWGA